MFINQNYRNYNYVVGVSDNYVILAKQDHVTADWNNPKTIDVIYQYLKPSFLTLESFRTFTSTTYFSDIDENSQSFYARADCNEIILSQFLIIFFVIFIFNGLTRFVKKGGVFFGN